jgi:hypothetical protein
MNKKDEELGAAMSRSLWESGRLRLPWGSEDARAASQLLIDEGLRRLPTDDLLMALWFIFCRALNVRYLRWRHGFKSRWDYNRKTPRQGTSPEPITWSNSYSNGQISRKYPAPDRAWAAREVARAARVDALRDMPTHRANPGQHDAYAPTH